MPDTTWALEIWTHPRLGTPTFVAALPHAGAQLYDRPDAVVDSFVQVPATRRDIIFEALKFDPITRASSRSRIIRAFRVDGGVRQTLPDHEFVAADLTYQLIGDGQQVARIAGPDLRGSADDASILPWDYPAQPSTARDWLWDGPNIFDNGFLEVISNERQSFWFDPLPGPTDTFQISFDGEITTAITWGSDANQRRADVKAAMEALTNTSLVEVTGAGGVGSKIEITWRGIRAGENLPQLTIINNTGGTPFSETEATGGFASLEGWTNIYNPITGATSGSQTIRVSSPDLGETGLNGSKACVIVPFQAGEQFSGGQVIVGVTPGQRYQLSILVDVTLTGNYRFVVRDMVGETESELKKTEVNLTAGVETTVTIADLDIPSDVNRVTVRFAIIDNPAGAGQIKMDELQIREGLQSANAGGIALALLNDLQTAHTPRTRLTWLTPDFDATNDSSATPWAISALPFAARDGQRFATHVLEGLRELGFSWDVVPDTLTTYQLKLWDLGNRGTDHTADDSIAFLIGQLAGGKFQMRLPEATNVRAVGADGAWSETEDADLVTAFGNIDGFIESEDWLDTAATTRAAQERLNAGIANALSLAATTTDSSGPVPWRDVSPGDTANWTLSDALVAKHPRTIAQVIVKIDGAGRWSCDWTGSRVFGGKSSQLEGLRALLTEFRRRLARGAKATPTVPSTASPTVYGGAGGLPSYTLRVAANNATAAEKAAADYICDGTNDEVEIQAAADALSGVAGKIHLSTGTFNLVPPAAGARIINLPTGVSLIGAGGASSFTGTILAVSGNTTGDFQTVVQGGRSATISGFIVSDFFGVSNPLIGVAADFDCTVEKCSFDTFPGVGVRMISSNVTIRNNLFQGLYRAVNTDSDLYVAGVDCVLLVTSNAQIVGNHFSFIDGHGVALHGAGTAQIPVIIESNTFDVVEGSCVYSAATSPEQIRFGPEMHDDRTTGGPNGNEIPHNNGSNSWTWPSDGSAVSAGGRNHLAVWTEGATPDATPPFILVRPGDINLLGVHALRGTYADSRGTEVYFTNPQQDWQAYGADIASTLDNFNGRRISGTVDLRQDPTPGTKLFASVAFKATISGSNGWRVTGHFRYYTEAGAFISQADEVRTPNQANSGQFQTISWLQLTVPATTRYVVFSVDVDDVLATEAGDFDLSNPKLNFRAASSERYNRGGLIVTGNIFNACGAGNVHAMEQPWPTIWTEAEVPLLVTSNVTMRMVGPFIRFAQLAGYGLNPGGLTVVGNDINEYQGDTLSGPIIDIVPNRSVGGYTGGIVIADNRISTAGSMTVFANTGGIIDLVFTGNKITKGTAHFRKLMGGLVSDNLFNMLDGSDTGGTDDVLRFDTCDETMVKGNVVRAAEIIASFPKRAIAVRYCTKLHLEGNAYHHESFFGAVNPLDVGLLIDANSDRTTYVGNEMGDAVDAYDVTGTNSRNTYPGGVDGDNW